MCWTWPEDPCVVCEIFCLIWCWYVSLTACVYCGLPLCDYTKLKVVDILIYWNTEPDWHPLLIYTINDSCTHLDTFIWKLHTDKLLLESLTLSSTSLMLFSLSTFTTGIQHLNQKTAKHQSCGSCSFGCVVTKMHWEPTAQRRAACDRILSAVCTQFVLSHIEGLPNVMQIILCLGSLTCQSSRCLWTRCPF